MNTRNGMRDSGLKRKKKKYWSTLIRTHAPPPQKKT